MAGHRVLSLEVINAANGQVSKFGEVHLPVVIVASPLESVFASPGTDLSEYLKRLNALYGKQYDFHILDFAVTVNPAREGFWNKDYCVRAVEVKGSINHDEPERTKRPLVLGTYPDTQFVDSNFQLTAEFKLGFDPANLLPKFLPVTASSTITGRFEWKPKVAAVESGRGTQQDGFYWKYEQTPQKAPLGDVPMACLIRRRKDLKSVTLLLYGTVEFGHPVGCGPIWYEGTKGGIDITPAIVPVELPDQ